MLISLDYKFIFIANLKSASTAIEIALRPFSNIALVEAQFDKHFPLFDIEERFAWVFDYVDRKEFLIFGVMRDPIDFVVSLYNSHSDPKFADAPGLYTGNIDFDRFLKEWPERNADQLVPQHTRFLARDGSIGANYIVSYAKLEEGLRYITARLGMPAICEVDRFNISEEQVLRENLTAEQTECIATRWDDDYRFMAKFCDRLLTKPE